MLIALLALGLYWVTLAPTVLWSDCAHLQLQAVRGTLQASAGSHPLWAGIAHLFSRIPVGDIAGRVNLVSAIFGALTVGLLRLIMHEVGLPRKPSLVATLAFGVSHTFWTHSVTAEAYSLTLSLMATLVWLALRWYHTGRVCYLAWVGLMAGLGLAAHLMVVLYAPALIWLAWRGRAHLDGRALLSFAVALVVGLVPLAGLMARDALMMGFDGNELMRWVLFTFEGYDFGPRFFDFSLHLLPSDVLHWAVFLGLQFVGLAGILGIIGAVVVWKVARRDLAVFLVLLYVGVMIFAFAYRVGERYAYYVPAYLPFAVWIGFGFARVRDPPWAVAPAFRAERWLWAGVVILVILVPLATYRLAPELVSRGITIRDARRVPGPRSKYFFLWPPKTGYDDARSFGEAALAAVPRNGVLLAEPILLEPMRFLQEVEGARPDVTLRYCCWDLEDALLAAKGRPIALAALAPTPHSVVRLEERYQLSSRGPIYLLEKRVP